MSQPAPQSISAFFPAYNDWATIASQVILVASVLRELVDDWEVIVVNDGSPDHTPVVLQELGKRIENLRVVTHPQNRGYGGALRSGFERTKVAAIGPVVAAELESARIRVDAMPEESYSMKPLVTSVCELLGSAR